MMPGETPRTSPVAAKRAAIRSEALNHAAAVLRQRAITVGIEHGDYAARIVLDDAILVSDLADEETPPYTHSYGLPEDAIRADERLRLIQHLQSRTTQSAQRVIEDLHDNGWPT